MPDDHATIAMGTKVVDPVCGMELDADHADALNYDGRTFHFCSVDCLERFQDEPEAYLREGQTVGPERF